MKDTSFDLADPDVLQFLQVRNFISAASFALLLYDYVLTLPQEISSIWRQTSKRTLIPWLFFLARYPAIAFFYLFSTTKPGIPLAELREHLEQTNYGLISEVQDWLFLICLAGCEGILLARTWALWRRSRRLLWVISTIYLGLLAVAVTMMLYPVWGSGEHQQNSFAYATIAAVETVIICLTVYSVVFHVRLRGSGHLLRVVYQDGVTYYCCILALSVANLMLHLRFTDKPLLLADLQLAVHSVLCTRVVLHLRSIPASSSQQDDLTEVTELSDLTHVRSTG